jgi:hypothetical protein
MTVDRLTLLTQLKFAMDGWKNKQCELKAKIEKVGHQRDTNNDDKCARSPFTADRAVSLVALIKKSCCFRPLAVTGRPISLIPPPTICVVLLCTTLRRLYVSFARLCRHCRQTRNRPSSVQRPRPTRAHTHNTHHRSSSIMRH